MFRGFNWRTILIGAATAALAYVLGQLGPTIIPPLK